MTANVIMRNQDNIEFMKSLDDDSMKLIVTSPPYNIGKSYEKRYSFEKYIEDQSKLTSTPP